MMKKRILVLLLILNSVFIHAQPLTINTSLSPTEIVQNTLLGNGITASNIQFNRSFASALALRDQIGVFTNGLGTNLGVTNGVILSTGKVQFAAGPNNLSGGSNQTSSPVTGDADLSFLSTNPTQNIAAVEFDFVSLGSEISLDFIYASEDYPEYANSIFNDVMGIFLSGPGISGPFSNNAQNIAVLPSTSAPISTNNINNGTTNNGPCENCSFYVNNGTGTTPVVNATIQYDGFTTELNTSASVQIGQTYHLKIAIANVADNLFDSAIFIRANSFKTSTLRNLSFESTKMTIFPNPASQAIQINLLDTVDTIDEITLSSIIGMEQKTNFSSIENTTFIDVSALSKGLYFVAVKTKNNFKYIQKLLIE